VAVTQTAGAGSTLTGVVAAVRGAVVRFGTTTVLHGVDLELVAGEVHAVVGQNGAGKSTLVKALMGVNPLAQGRVEVDGQAVSLSGPQDARRLGLEIVYQDQPLAPQLDVVENMFLGREMTRGGVLLDRAAMRRTAQQALDRVGAAVSVAELVGDLTPTQRVQVSIAAALAAEPRVLVLDEPTAALGAAEAGPVFDLVRIAAERGVAVLYISHRLGEITSLADRITVLRDGRLVHTGEAATLTTDGMIALMVGRELEALYPDVPHTAGEVLLSVRGLRSGALVGGMDLEIRTGEIVGLAGLVGSGASETLLALFGGRSATGEVTVGGRSGRPRSPREATARGMAYVPEERRTEAIFPGLSLRDNITAASLRKHSTAGVLDRAAERTTADQLISRLGIVASSPEQDIATLSGGNQQKGIVGRWLARGGQLYLVDEPTAGVDVGAKAEIYRQLGELAAEGVAVLVVSSDFEELVGLCDRILVVRDGAVTGEYSRGSVEVDELTALAAATEGTAGHGGDAEQRRAPAPGEPLPSRRPGRPWIRQTGLAVGMLATIALLGLGSSGFRTTTSLLDVVRQAGTPALLAAALAIALGAGVFDLSVGAIALTAATVSATLVVDGTPALLALLAGVGIGAVIGIANGAITVGLRVPPFVATLGMMFLLVGATLGINHGLSVAIPPESSFLMFGRGYVGWLPVVALFALVVIAVVTLLWRRTTIGLWLRAVGNDAHTAGMRGVDEARTKLVALVLSGALSGLAGSLLASYSSGSTAGNASMDLLVTALAAAFLGSAMTRSFLFDPATAAVGSLFVTAVGAGLISNGLSDQWLPGVQGAVLLIAVLLAVVRRRALGQVSVF
jgi:ABC-type sugar transport system ATPase subunit/ribose/xylose/arabinose/galactoside ABC-type transport system permease subunit